LALFTKFGDLDKNKNTKTCRRKCFKNIIL